MRRVQIITPSPGGKGTPEVYACHPALLCILRMLVSLRVLLKGHNAIVSAPEVLFGFHVKKMVNTVTLFRPSLPAIREPGPGSRIAGGEGRRAT